MNSVVLVNIALLLSAGMLALFYSRGAAVLLLFLPASQVLGLVRPMAIAEKGVMDVHLLVSLIVIGLIIASVSQFHELGRARLIVPMLCLSGFWIYGVLYPLRDGGSTLFYSLKASKEFFTVFSYFAILLFLRTERDIRWGWRCLLGLGLYYSVLEIAAQAMGEGLLRHLTFDYNREGQLFWKVYVTFWPVILIAFFHAFFRLTQRAGRPYGALLFATFGLLFTFFRSYLLGAAGAIPLVLMLARHRVGTIMSQIAFFGTVLGFAILVMGLFWNGTSGKEGGVFDLFVMSGLTELQTQKGGAIEGREVFSKGRRMILQRSPYSGYGFIDKDSKDGRRYQEDIIGDVLGFIDKGDVDTALKFGAVGRALLYATFAYVAWALIRLANQRLSQTLNVRCLALAATIVVFLVVQPVHAPLTYSFGLLPLGIALGLIERERILALQDRVVQQPLVQSEQPMRESAETDEKRILSW